MQIWSFPYIPDYQKLEIFIDFYLRKWSLSSIFPTDFIINQNQDHSNGSRSTGLLQKWGKFFLILAILIVSVSKLMDFLYVKT